MSTAQLRLVQEAPPATGTTTDPTRRVFEYWLFMFDRSPRRCKLTPERRQAINAALALYELDMVLQAVEGIAALPLDDVRGGDRQRDAMREIEWFLGKGSRIERLADHGLRLRLNAEQSAREQRADPPTRGDGASPALVAQHMEKLRQLARVSRGAMHG